MIRTACFPWIVAFSICAAGCGDSPGTADEPASDDTSGSSGGSSGTNATGGPAMGGGGPSIGTGGDSNVGGNGGAAQRDASAALDSSGGGGRAGSPGRDASNADADNSMPLYDPCPAKGTPCAIMPLGDSISYGDGSTNHAGYRAPLFHLTHSNGQNITFVGGFMDGPDTVDGVPFPKHHEGHSGYEIAGDHGIAPFTAAAIKANSPHIVLLMIGTNDIAFNNDPPNAPSRLGGLLDIILDTDPKMLLVVGQIVPTTDDGQNALVMAYNAAIPALVKARFDAGKHIAMVDMYGTLTADPNYKVDYMFNKYHPNDAGYVNLAETWYAKIGSILR